MNISLSKIFQPIITLFTKFQVTLFFVVLVGGLAYCVLTINNILTQKAGSDGYTSTLITGSLDKVTMDQLQSLKQSTDPNITITLPAGRINPLTE